MPKPKLFAPASYWSLTPAQRREITNGCGPGRGILNVLIPDSFLGLSVHAACDIHDWMYFEGKTIADKDEADRTFLNNMVRLIEADDSFWGKFMEKPRLTAAYGYYEAVHKFGGSAFWNDKNPDGTMRVSA